MAPSQKLSCKNNEKFTYTGKEMSPLGLGYCADAESVGTQMVGRDNKNWIIGVKNNDKIWMRAPENKNLQPEEPLLKKEDDDETEAVEQPKVEEVKPKRKYTKKADKKTTESDNSEAEEKTDEQPEEKTEEKPKRKYTRKPKEVEEGAEVKPKRKYTKKADKNKEEEGEEKKEKKTRKKNGPSGYNLFIGKKINEYRQEETGLKTTEYMKKAQEAWKTMSKEEQATISAELKTEYMANLPIQTEA